MTPGAEETQMRRSHARRVVLVSFAGLVFALLSASPAIAQPANDEISGATPITLGTTVTQDTTDATAAPTDKSECGFPVSNTVWFSFTATESQPLFLDTSGSTYSGTMSVLTDLGSGPAEIACGGLGGFNDARFDADAGRTYFFMAAGFFGGGTLQLTLRPALVMTVVIEPIGAVNRQGTVVVTGTLTCSQGVAARLDVTVRQRVSKTLVIEGSTQLLEGLFCPTTPTTWNAVIIGSNGPFRKGQAEVFVTGLACEERLTARNCDNPELRSLVDLRRTDK